MVQVIHKTHGLYSGPVIYGQKIDPNTNTDFHVRRAVIVTEGVETGYRVGSVMAADGTGMTCGRGQHILVYPRELANEDFDAENDQGGLGKLLCEIEVKAPSQELEVLYGALNWEEWYVARDGKLRWLKDMRVMLAGRWVDCNAGDVVHGNVLRNAITPVNGKVPKKGERWQKARQWALFFHNVFSNPSSFKVQFDFEVDHLVQRTGHRKFAFHENRRKETILQVVYGGCDIRGLRVGEPITEELDLAMCVFHSHTVNAPSVSFRTLRDVLRVTGYEYGSGASAEASFARQLLRALAKVRYGRWNEDIRGGRWARTRECARKSGMWPARFFSGQNPIMPVKF